MNGQGKLTFENGDAYEGEFSNGIFNGKGTYKSAQGWTYTGQFKMAMRMEKENQPPKDKQHTKEHLNRDLSTCELNGYRLLGSLDFICLTFITILLNNFRWLCWGRPILYPVWLSDNCNALLMNLRHTKKLTSLPFSVVESIALFTALVLTRRTTWFWPFGMTSSLISVVKSLLL